jgi:alpha-ribazole phosphatase
VTDEGRTRLYLVRHGETEGAPDRFYGWTDVALSQAGRMRMLRLADRLMGQGVSELFCSPLRRARESADVLATRLDIGLTVCPELREWNFGRWEGLAYAEVAARYPEDVAARQRDRVGFRFPGGETLADLDDRVTKWMAALVERCRGEAVGIVAHGGVNRVILCRALGMPLEHLLRIEQDFSCLNIVDYFPDDTLVRLING